uniref:Uncharacterized protein n=1 Tax=mine drainage metagenome TaxID=410659 RepID=E6QHK0_9ZZZZ
MRHTLFPQNFSRRSGDCGGGVAGDGHFEHLGDAVFGVAGGDAPAALRGEMEQLVGGVAHEDADACPVEHGFVIPVVADGHGLLLGDAEARGETLDGGALGDAGREQVEDGEIMAWIGGADDFDLAGEWRRGDQALGLGHLAEGSGGHALDDVYFVAESGFDGLDGADGAAIGLDPLGEATAGDGHVFDDKVGRGGLVEGEDGHADAAQEGGEVAGKLGADVFEVNAVAGEGSGHCSVGRNEGRVRSQADVGEQRGSECLTAASGDGDNDARLLGFAECVAVAAADDGAEVGEQGSVHVNCDEADGRGECGVGHGFSLPAGEIRVLVFSARGGIPCPKIRIENRDIGHPGCGCGRIPRAGCKLWGMERMCERCYARVVADGSETCPACGGKLVAGPVTANGLERDVDHRGIVLPARHAVGGIITPR